MRSRDAFAGSRNVSVHYLWDPVQYMDEFSAGSRLGIIYVGNLLLVLWFSHRVHCFKSSKYIRNESNARLFWSNFSAKDVAGLKKIFILYSTNLKKTNLIITVYIYGGPRNNTYSTTYIYIYIFFSSICKCSFRNQLIELWTRHS